jgi:4-amino-4-deoxy-L-arabinose transferase-like glycosyltransferase
VILLKEHRGFFIVLAFAAVLFLSDIWVYQEFVRAESYFALGSRLMIESGDWLTPHAPDEMPLNKPPLTYWLIGAAYKLFGANFGSARLPSVLAALCVLGIVYSFGTRLYGKRAGLLAVAVLATSFLFLSFARLAMSDMLLTLFVTGAMACFILVLNTPGSSSTGLALCGYAALALGVLAKGPVAIVLVAAPIGLELGLRRSREDLKKLRLFPGLGLLVLIAAPYFLAVYARSGAAPLWFFFLGENLQRFTGSIYGASGRPVWFELPAFFSDFAPWSVLVPCALWFDWRGRANASRATRPLYLWLVSTIVLFSLSSFKLDYYLLPAMPAAALIVAPWIANAEVGPRFMRRVVVVFLVLCSATLVVIALLSLKAAPILSVATSLRFVPVVLAAGGLAAIMICLARRKVWAATIILTSTMWLVFIAIQSVFLPGFVAYLPASRLAAAVPAGSAVFTSKSASDWANCIAFNIPAPHKVERMIGDNLDEKLLAGLANDSKAVAVIRESEYARLIMHDPNLRILARAETFGHGGLSLKVIRDPREERLLLIGH